MPVRLILLLLLLLCPWGHAIGQQSRWFAGGGTGISTLSGDARSVITAASTSVSQYKPENGGLVHVFAGRHWREYLSTQAVYSWNRNDLALLSTQFAGGVETTYEQARTSRQHNLGADGLVYFRSRTSFVRPYLAIGVGVMSFDSRATALRVSKGQPTPPGAAFGSTKIGLRAAAGIDLMLKGGWGIRYAFLETIQGNPVSGRLSPAGKRGLANFQNLFGVVKYFR